MVKLRAHHLLCLLTYVGKGYSDAFTANFDTVVARIVGGEVVQVVEGPDDICAALLKGRESPREHQCHCLTARVGERDRLAASAVEEVLQRPIKAGERLLLDERVFTALRRAFRDRDNRVRGGCQGCQWFGLCTTVAADGYVHAVID